MKKKSHATTKHPVALASPKAGALEAENNNNGISDEIQLQIFSLLDEPEALAKAAAVSKTWKRISEEPLLWQRFGFISRDDFNNKNRQQPQRQEEALLHVCQKREEKQNLTIHLFGDSELKKTLFGNVNLEKFKNPTRMIVIGDSAMKVLISKATSKDTPLDVMDIALIGVKNKKDVDCYLKLFIKRPDVLLLFVIHADQLHEFNKQPANAIVISNQETFLEIYKKVLEKIDKLKSENTATAKVCTIN